MTILFKEQIKQLTSYLSNVLLNGIDVSALYIIQAQLTTIKASVKPSTLLMNSFSTFQIKKILTYSKQYFQRLKYRSNTDSLQQHQSYNDDLNRFNVSLRDLEEKPIKEIGVVSERIMDTLQEWESLSTKTNILREKLGTLTEYSLCLSSDDSLKEQLESLICLVDISTIGKQFKNLAESTECFSLTEENELTQVNRQLKVLDIAIFLKTVLIWSHDILEQISEFSALIEIIRADTSFDIESEVDNHYKHNHKRQTLLQISTEESSGRKQRISSITEHLSKAKQNQDLSKHPLALRKKKYSHNTTNQKGVQRPLRPMNILSDINWNNRDSHGEFKRKESEAPQAQKVCQKCEIY